MSKFLYGSSSNLYGFCFLFSLHLGAHDSVSFVTTDDLNHLSALSTALISMSQAKPLRWKKKREHCFVRGSIKKKKTGQWTRPLSCRQLFDDFIVSTYRLCHAIIEENILRIIYNNDSSSIKFKYAQTHTEQLNFILIYKYLNSNYYLHKATDIIIQLGHTCFRTQARNKTREIFRTCSLIFRNEIPSQGKACKQHTCEHVCM